MYLKIKIITAFFLMPILFCNCLSSKKTVSSEEASNSNIIPLSSLSKGDIEHKRSSFLKDEKGITYLDNQQISDLSDADLLDRVLFYGIPNSKLKKGLVSNENVTKVRDSDFYKELKRDETFSIYFRKNINKNGVEVNHGLLMQHLEDKNLVKLFGF